MNKEGDREREKTRQWKRERETGTIQHGNRDTSRDRVSKTEIQGETGLIQQRYKEREGQYRERDRTGKHRVQRRKLREAERGGNVRERE